MNALYLCLMTAQSLAIIKLWTLLDRHVAEHGPFPTVRRYIRLNSVIYSVASLILMLLILLSPHEDLPRHLYHASKFWEYVDILSDCAIGRTMDFHLGFYRLTIPWFTFFRVLQHHEGWWVFGAANAGHLVLTYAYLGGVKELRYVLDDTAFLQLILGIGVDGWLVIRKSSRNEAPVWPNVLGAALLGTYLILWMRESRMRRRGQNLRRVKEVLELQLHHASATKSDPGVSHNHAAGRSLHRDDQ